MNSYHVERSGGAASWYSVCDERGRTVASYAENGPAQVRRRQRRRAAELAERLTAQGAHTVQGRTRHYAVCPS